MLLLTLFNEFGVAIRYGLHGPVFELRWGRVFLDPSIQFKRPTQPPLQTNQPTKQQTSKKEL